MQRKRYYRFIAVVLVLTLLAGLGITAGADNTAEDIVREADVTVPGSGNVLVAVSGSAAVQSEKQALLDTLNALRKEACDKGYPNPENPAVTLTSDDYIPLTWNSDLEEMAQLRAAEGIVEESVMRPSGKYSGTIVINGTGTSREDIGWGWANNAEGAALTDLPELFYGYSGTDSEISRWITGGYAQDDPEVAHYAHLINPTYLSVGSAMFKISNATISTGKKDYYNRAALCMVQEMSRNETPAAKQVFSDLGGDYTQKVEAKTDYISGLEFDEDTVSAMETGTRETLVPTAMIHAGKNAQYAHEIYIPGCSVTSGAAWSSSNTSRATVNKNGRVSARKAGSVTITASVADHQASQSIRITGEDADMPEDDVTERFEDVYPNMWYTPGIEYCVDNGIMAGMSESQFVISGNVDRAMVVTTLWAMEGKPEPSGSVTFSDLPDGRYFTKAVKWAAENEIVSGHATGEFRPLTPVLRQQLVAILYQYARYRNLDTQASGSLAAYTDQAEINGYAVLPFRWAVGHGLISGRTETTLAPQGPLTRAELATILMRFMQNIISSEG